MRRRRRGPNEIDLPAGERERLTSIDALLRSTAARDRAEERSARPGPAHLSLVPAAPQRSEPTHELMLTFAQLALVHKSLQAARTLAVLPPQDELLTDTIQLVDAAMRRAL